MKVLDFDMESDLAVTAADDIAPAVLVVLVMAVLVILAMTVLDVGVADTVAEAELVIAVVVVDAKALVVTAIMESLESGQMKKRR